MKKPYIIQENNIDGEGMNVNKKITLATLQG